jgi:hypothetical protein
MNALSDRNSLPVGGIRLAFADRMRRLLRISAAPLDVEALPEHLKRDLGLIGGRAAQPRDPYRD